MKNITIVLAGVCFGKAMHKPCMAFLLMAGFLLASFPSQAQAPPCSGLEGYTLKGTFNGHTYFISNFTAYGPDAVIAASSTGGHLATIADAAENGFVAAAANYDFAWIGLTDVNEEGTFVWVTGESVTYTNWQIFEPNNAGSIGEHWTVINYGPGKWNDFPDGGAIVNNIDYSRPFIVEFDGIEGDDDCDGVSNCSDVCPGADDSGPCTGEGWPFEVPANYICSNNSNSEKYLVCHEGNTICISSNAVATHLAHGDFLGPCSGCDSEAFVSPFKNINAATDKSLVPDFTVYPNPSYGDFKIELNPSEIGVLEIYNQNGQVMQSFQVEGQRQLDINLYQSGVYYVQLTTNQQVITRKVTVAR